LSVHKDIKMIAEADNGMQLLTVLKHVQPDVILLDIQMPIMDGSIRCLKSKNYTQRSK
jgi:YesN/AraC family two-component response regulator